MAELMVWIIIIMAGFSATSFLVAVGAAFGHTERSEDICATAKAIFFASLVIMAICAWMFSAYEWQRQYTECNALGAERFHFKTEPESGIGCRKEYQSCAYNEAGTEWVCEQKFKRVYPEGEK